MVTRLLAGIYFTVGVALNNKYVYVNRQSFIYQKITLHSIFFILYSPGDTATEEDNNSIAVYFDKKRQNLLAGKFYMLAGHYTKALGHLTRCPVTDTGESIELCIQTVSCRFFSLFILPPYVKLLQDLAPFYMTVDSLSLSNSNLYYLNLSIIRTNSKSPFRSSYLLTNT